MIRSLRGAISALLDDPAEGWLDRKLARTILGTDDAGVIAEGVEAYVREVLGAGVRGCSLFTQSVGVVWALAIEGREEPIVLKAHRVGGAALRSVASMDELSAVYAAHARMAEHGIACARVLSPPRAWPGFADGAIAAMSFLDVPRSDDPHDPAARRAMAEELARTASIGRAIAGRAELAHLPRVRRLEGELFPAPHNALFDLSVAGGEWIDARAAVARATEETLPERPLVMHTDVSGANVKVAGGRVVAVFDMDSVARIDEMACLASAAVHFSYRGDPPWTWPTREEAIAFAEDYARARGRPFDRDERGALNAAAIRAMAYTARCEHGMQPAGEGAMRERLRAAPDAYFD
jgi:hypothetical protein